MKANSKKMTLLASMALVTGLMVAGTAHAGLKAIATLVSEDFSGGTNDSISTLSWTEVTGAQGIKISTVSIGGLSSGQTAQIDGPPYPPRRRAHLGAVSSPHRVIATR